VLGLSAFTDAILSSVVPLSIPAVVPRPFVFEGLMVVIAVAVVLLSIKPVLNLISKNQLMNYSYNPFHLVNTYGAFGSVTKQRYEIVLEGTHDSVVTRETRWQEYGFKAKPGDPSRRPPQVAPYHLRLDWLMWFLPFSVRMTAAGISQLGYERWFVRFVQRLLENDRATLRLLGHNPFKELPPKFVRALYYLYRYSSATERRDTGSLWTRRLVDVYLPAVSLTDVRPNHGREGLTSAPRRGARRVARG